MLYQRDNCSYVLHRVYEVKDSLYTMIGDGQDVLEYGIRQNQLIAVVSFCVRKDKRLQPGDFWWEFFAKVWISHISFRKPVFNNGSPPVNETE